MSTPFDESDVMNFEGMSLKEIRIARLRAFAAMRNARGPVELGRLIGRKANQTSDLLSGKASFGEKLARSIEIAAGLPERWLDAEKGAFSYWPFSDDLQLAISNLNAAELLRVENLVRAHLGLEPVKSIDELVDEVDVHQGKPSLPQRVMPHHGAVGSASNNRSMEAVKSTPRPARPATPALGAEDARLKGVHRDERDRHRRGGKPKDGGRS